MPPSCEETSVSQGLIGGTFWGVLAAGFGLVVVSQVADPPAGVPPVPVATVVASAETATTRPAGSALQPTVPATAPVTVPQVSPATAPAIVTTAPTAAKPAPDAVAAKEAPQLHAPSKDAAPAVAAAPEPAGSALPQLTAQAQDERPPVDATATADPPVVSVLPRPAPPADAAASATAAVDPAPGAKFVSVQPKKTGTDDAVATAEPARSTPPKLVTVAPEVIAARVLPAGQPNLPGPAAPPAASPRPAAIVVAGPAPAAPVPSAQDPAPTVVVTQAPRAVPPATLARAEGTSPAPAAMARSGFQPGLIGPVEAPAAADAPPATGALPPPPPLTPEELAILAKAGALPPGAPDQGLPEIIVLTEAADPAKPSILKKPEPLVPVPSLAAKGQVPATERLPKVAPVAPAPEIDTAPDAAPEAVVTLPDDAPPIDRFARAFDNAAGKPLFAVVLIDTGDPLIDRTALAAIPFPVTFALDPSAPSAALAASIYRAAGQEVVMLATGLPAGATAADVEVSFGAHEAALPEAVAVMDLEAGGFQGDRPLSTLVVPVLAGQGRGLLSWDRGLNAASQVARREGLRSGVIFRRLDGEGEPVAQMRRYLDRAAFKAAQDGRVIVAGETRANTVAAILEWAVEGRASTVALAPLTATLRAE